MKRYRDMYALTAVLCAVAVAPEAAWSQTAAAAAGQPAPQAQGSASADAVNEVVVTAQRREQRLQDVPISVTAVTGSVAAAAGVTSTSSLTSIVPSLQFSRQSGNGGAPFIRGVGSTSAAPGNEPPVAVYIDDVYIGAPSATVMGLNNLDQIEVLKGPQGTLFGRNATGGVISFRTRRPSEIPEADASVGYGNYNTVDGNFYATSGIAPNLAANIAFNYHDQGDGYGHDINTGTDVYKSRYYSVRSEALWRPTDATSLRLSADMDHYWGDSGLNVSIFPGTVSTGGQTYPGRYNSTQVPPDQAHTNDYGFSARFDQDLGVVRLASITAYRYSFLNFSIDSDGSVANIIYSNLTSKFHNVSEEVQLLSPTNSKLQWIAGAFYYSAVGALPDLYQTGTSVAAFGGRTDLESSQTVQTYAGFVDANYEILPDTRLTGGLRYTTDRFGLSADKEEASGALLPGFPLTAGASFSKLTYRAVLDHHFTPDLMVFASTSRGFKSGGYNLQTPTLVVGGVTTVAPPVAPEVLDAYEIGLKAQLFDRRLQLNPSLFLYNYNNMQVTVLGTSSSSTINAAAARMQGFDLDFDARVTSQFELTGGLEALDAHFVRFPNGPIYVPQPAVCTPTPHTTGPLTGGNLTCAADLSGRSTPRSPKFTASLNAIYKVPTSIGTLTFTGTVYHNSGFTWDAEARLRQPEYTTLNARAAWKSINERYELSLWAKNLSNAYYFDYVSASPTRDSGQPAMPRSYGVTIGLHF